MGFRGQVFATLRCGMARGKEISLHAREAAQSGTFSGNAPRRGRMFHFSAKFQNQKQCVMA
jgi:hypothetical protein